MARPGYGPPPPWWIRPQFPGVGTDPPPIGTQPPVTVRPYVGNVGFACAPASGPTSFTFGVSANVGDAVLLFVALTTSQTLSFADSFGSTWNGWTISGTNNSGYFWWCPYLLGTNPTVTCNGQSGRHPLICWVQVVGGNDDALIDGVAPINSASIHTIASTARTTAPNGLIVASADYSSASANTWTAGYSHQARANPFTGVSLDVAWSTSPLATWSASPAVTLGGGSIAVGGFGVALRAAGQYPDHVPLKPNLPTFAPWLRQVPIDAVAGGEALSANLSLALTGLKSTSAIGALSSAETSILPLTGRVITSTEGSITSSQAVTRALVGSKITSAKGAVSSAETSTLALTGQKITSAKGAVGSAETSIIPLTGRVITSAKGSVTSSETSILALTGQVITSVEGVVTSAAGSPDVSRALTGLQSVFAQGQIALSGDAVPFVPASFDAGVAGRPKRVLYLIKVDGREVATHSLAEALEILAQVKRLAVIHAQKLAREATERALLTSSRPQPLRPALPKISGSRPLTAAVREVRKEIEDIYAAAFRDAEIGMLLELGRRADEDEDITLLLM